MNQTLTNATGAAQPMTDIRDIKPILPLHGMEWLPVTLVILGCILLAILAWFAWKWWKKRTKNASPIPVLLPHEQAFKDLDQLQAASDLGDKPYYFRISQILRAYVGARFHINALEMTTEELLPALKQTPLRREELRDIKAFCISSDLVKYATAEMGTKRRTADHDLVRNLVARTAEQPKAEGTKPEQTIAVDTMPQEIKR